MANRKADEYKTVKFYAENTKAKKAGFSKFNLENEYYFCRYIDGDIAMISQAYTSAAGRDNGIESVKKNEKLVKRYVFEKRGTKSHGFALKAGNGQEIAISPDYDSLEKAEHISGRLTGKKKAKKSTPTKKKPTAKKAASKTSAVTPKKKAAAAFTSGDTRIENYRPLSFYEKHGGKADGFNSFEQDGAYYFHYNTDGETVLISESYTTARGRDNGVASVKKNMKLKSAYQHHTHKNGKHYFDINAANHQEIATSRWYASEPKALEGAAMLRGEKIKSRASNVEQNYMPLAFYKKATSGKADGFETFKGNDGEHYFVYRENGKIALISEGYPTATVRDKGMASVEKNMKTESRYVFAKGADGKDGFALRAGNNKEIARSIGYGSAAAAAAGAAYLMGTRKRADAKPKAAATAAGLAATSAAAKPAEAKPVASKPVEKKPAPIAAAPIAAAALGTAGVAGAAAMSAAPKAEPVAAAPVVAATPAPIAAAAAPAAASGGGGIWGWLKWLLMLLIALLAMFFLFKACAGGDKAVTASPAATTSETASAAAMVSCWNGSKARSEQACPAKVTCWDNSFATSLSACPVQPPAMNFDCWDGSKAVDQAGCPVRPTTSATSGAAANGNAAVASVNSATKTPAGTTVKNTAPKVTTGNTTSSAGTTVKMTAPSVAGRICGPSPNVLFNISSATPKSVAYLGSNPQFGNSLTYTPEEFFRRLQVKYRTSPRDKAFLNLMAKSLGYTSFADMDASMFSDDTLPNGTSGLLGFGTQHALQYSTLNVTDPTHLEAFKVRSVNGADVHFMKRCGNYMYVCEP